MEGEAKNGNNGEYEGRGRRTHCGWSPHHSLGNKPAVYGQLLICWIIIPFYPQLNQQQNNTLHKRRKAPPQQSTQCRERDRVEVKCVRDDCSRKWGKFRTQEKWQSSIKMKMKKSREKTLQIVQTLIILHLCIGVCPSVSVCLVWIADLSVYSLVCKQKCNMYKEIKEINFETSLRLSKFTLNMQSRFANSPYKGN